MNEKYTPAQEERLEYRECERGRQGGKLREGERESEREIEIEKERERENGKHKGAYDKESLRMPASRRPAIKSSP